MSRAGRNFIPVLLASWLLLSGCLQYVACEDQTPEQPLVIIASTIVTSYIPCKTKLLPRSTIYIDETTTVSRPHNTGTPSGDTSGDASSGAQNAPSSGLSPGAKAGIAVGVIGAVIGLASLAWNISKSKSVATMFSSKTTPEMVSAPDTVAKGPVVSVQSIGPAATPTPYTGPPPTYASPAPIMQAQSPPWSQHGGLHDIPPSSQTPQSWNSLVHTPPPTWIGQHNSFGSSGWSPPPASPSMPIVEGPSGQMTVPMTDAQPNTGLGTSDYGANQASQGLLNDSGDTSQPNTGLGSEGANPPNTGLGSEGAMSSNPGLSGPSPNSYTGLNSNGTSQPPSGWSGPSAGDGGWLGSLGTGAGGSEGSGGAEQVPIVPIAVVSRLRNRDRLQQHQQQRASLIQRQSWDTHGSAALPSQQYLLPASRALTRPDDDNPAELAQYDRPIMYANHTRRSESAQSIPRRPVQNMNSSGMHSYHGAPSSRPAEMPMGDRTYPQEMAISYYEDQGTYRPYEGPIHRIVTGRPSGTRGPGHPATERWNSGM